MKKATRRKLLGIVLALALVIGALNMNVWNAKAEGEESTTQARPTASATGAFANGSAEGDLTPSIQYQITHSPIGVSDGKEYDLVLALDISSSMVTNNEGTRTRMAVAADAAKGFLGNLGDNVSVSLLGFRNEVISGSSIDELAGKASRNTSGTYIADAVKEAARMLANSEKEKVLVIVSDGDPYGKYNDPKGETKTQLTAALNAGIAVYAIGFKKTVEVFDEKHVTSYVTASNATQLNAAFSNVADTIYRYADAWIEAKIGSHVTYIGNASGVSVENGWLKWDATDTNAFPRVSNIQTSPAVDFAVSVGEDGYLTASDSMDEATKKSIICELIRMAKKGDDEITLDYAEDGTIMIKVAVTTEAYLYYRFEGTTVGPVDVDVQATATVYSGEYPQAHYQICYAVDGEDIKLEPAQEISYDFDAEPTTGDAIKYVYPVSKLGDFADEDYSAPSIEGPYSFSSNLDHGTLLFYVQYTHNDPTPEIPETPSELESTVRFIVDGNENNPYYTETRVVGASVDVPVNPTKGGFSFRGWSLNGTDVVTVNTVHTEADVTYYAVFRENKENDDPKPTPEKDKPYIPPFEEDPEEDPKEEEPVVVPEPEVPAGEPEVVVPEPEVPAGEPEVVVPEPEVPAGEPEIELPEPEVPAGGELPQTGTTPVAVFYGIGGACIVLGGVIFIASRRKKRV